MTTAILILLALALAKALLAPSRAHAAELEIQRPAIVLVTPGSADPNDLPGLLNMERRVTDAFPCYEVFIAFSMPEVRKIWVSRAHDTNFRKYFPWVEDRFYDVRNLLSVLALIQEVGPRLVLVQPLELVDGQDFQDAAAVVEALRNIKAVERSHIPFPYISLGNPAMGLGDGQKECLFQVAGALKPLFAEAEKEGAAVLLVSDAMGEANTRAYRGFAEVLRSLYDPKAYVGIPHARRGTKLILEEMEKELEPSSKIILGSLSFFMGDDAKEELFGSFDESWSSIITAKGYDVIPYSQPLAASDRYADLFINSLKKMEETVSRRYTD
ncbi:MAG: sirohydrochlorin cobaltochelatase [Deltaproteobacteria bacterium]|jgi:cobalamin biosynthesis Co2+ chelatase CbiK|nr:sirohydrochlorin cobaltochelatase [Deltaproteobacteria bacterium]